MKQKCVAAVISLLFFGTCVIPGIAQNIEDFVGKSKSTWLYVGGTGPGNYTKIQDAVNCSSDGDTVFVFSGIYPEWVKIEKSIHLIGEDKNTTFIEGGWGYGVYIYADTVFVTGFTIRNCGYYYCGGITLNSDNNSIIGNILVSNIVGGIYVYGDNNTIANNSIRNNDRGISITSGCYNTMTENIIEANERGIIFVEIRNQNQHISNNTIIENVIKNNFEGIVLQKGNVTIISNNLITNNECGIIIGFSSLVPSNSNIINHNIFSYNTYGLSLYDSTNNDIYYNNFIKNACQASDESYSIPCENQWDNGYPLGGNYWSDYNGSDEYNGPNQDIPGNDSIGDIPYSISGSTNSVDRFPFMKPLVQFPPYQPIISAFSWGIENVEYTFTVTCIDPNGDKVFCRWDWGEGNITEWRGPFFSGESIDEEHTWYTNRSYEIRAQLKDVYGEQSDWSDPYLFEVHGKKRAFIFGKYSILEQQNGTITIEAINLHVLFFRPLQMLHYIQGEAIILLDDPIWGLMFPQIMVVLVYVIT